MNKTAVIFGGGGQDGFFLNKLLLSLDYQVIVFTHKDGKAGASLDVSDFDGVKTALIKYRPEIIFHLAARSSTRHEFILENHKAIVDGALAILEAVDRHIPNSKVFIASSALIFKNEGVPINENNELITDTAYSLARVEALHIARYYRMRGRKVYVGFLFNHESHMRPAHSVVREVARGVVDIHFGLHESLSVGNAGVIKEWMWAGDAVDAIFSLVDQNDIFEACIGDGIGRSVHDYAIACCEVVGISLEEHIIEIPNYEAEYSALVSDSKKISSLGWTPKFNMKSLAKKMIEAEISSRRL
ncbi:MAG: NAD-dependent epimerase/dehydratase family protein [Candidatus Marinimicrobia bacterium]|jgi:GDPmannose 4,6-dehydratase|nr:NAD-dependent epimerase/dehydratase family protein [Candidatus Neomarinimicrobiota bacterium]